MRQKPMAECAEAFTDDPANGSRRFGHCVGFSPS
jgi:hypothetical protein